MALVISPLYPVAGAEVTLSATALVGTTAVYELTSVPSESALATGLLLSDVAGSELVPEDMTDAIERGYNTDVFTPDVPGEYGITVYDMLEMVGVPSYPGDPSGEHLYLLQAVQSGTAHVGTVLELPITTIRGFGGTLQLTIVNETVRGATIAETADEWSRSAVLVTAVQTALTTLVGTAVNSIGNDLSTDVGDLLTNYEAHRVLVGGGPVVHSVADTANAVARTVPNSTAGAMMVLAELYRVIMAHLEDGSAAAADWHGDDDYMNLPLTAPGNTLGQATVCCAELRERVYERHRVQAAAPACHGVGDATNDLTGPTALDNIIVAYLDELATIAPAAVAGEPEGAMDARQRYGFR